MTHQSPQFSAMLKVLGAVIVVAVLAIWLGWGNPPDPGNNPKQPSTSPQPAHPATDAVATPVSVDRVEVTEHRAEVLVVDGRDGTPLEGAVLEKGEGSLRILSRSDGALMTNQMGRVALPPTMCSVGLVVARRGYMSVSLSVPDGESRVVRLQPLAHGLLLCMLEDGTPVSGVVIAVSKKVVVGKLGSHYGEYLLGSNSEDAVAYAVSGSDGRVDVRVPEAGDYYVQPYWEYGACLRGEIYESRIRLDASGAQTLLFRRYLGVVVQSPTAPLAAWVCEVDPADSKKIERRQGHLLVDKEQVADALRTRLGIPDCAVFVPIAGVDDVSVSIAGFLVTGESFACVGKAVRADAVVPHTVAVVAEQQIGTLNITCERQYGVPVLVSDNFRKLGLEAAENSVLRLPAGSYSVAYAGRWVGKRGQGATAVVRPGEITHVALSAPDSRPQSIVVKVRDLPIVGRVQLAAIDASGQRSYLYNWYAKVERWIWLPKEIEFLEATCPGYQCVTEKAIGNEQSVVFNLEPKRD